MTTLKIVYAGQAYYARGDHRTLCDVVITIRRYARDGCGWVTLPGDSLGTGLLITPGVPVAAQVADPDDDVKSVADIL